MPAVIGRTSTARAGVTPSLSRWDRAWRKAVKYPTNGQWYRATGHFDLLRSLRTVMRLTTCALVLMVGLVGAVMVGVALPEWTANLMGVVAVGIMFSTTPSVRHVTASMALTYLRPGWSETWLDAEVPLPRLWMMGRSPISPEEFAGYARSLDKDTSARLDGGIDPRLVWALVERGITPEQMADFRDAGLTALDAVRLCDRNITLQEWRQIIDIGIPARVRPEQVLRFVDWVRLGPASLHPSEFGQRQEPRTVTECLPVMAAWTRLERFEVGHPTGCPKAGSGKATLPCAQCGGSPRGGHRDGFINQSIGRSPVEEWAQTTGALAPHFIAAGIGIDEAAAMLATEPQPRVEDLEFLSAFRD